VTNTSNKSEFVNFKTLARSTAITQPTTTHFLLDFLNGEFNTRRQPLKHDDERLSMRFTSGQQAEHGLRLPGAPAEFCFCR
jgi:hypothetical protein